MSLWSFLSERRLTAGRSNGSGISYESFPPPPLPRAFSHLNSKFSLGQVARCRWPVAGSRPPGLWRINEAVIISSLPSRQAASHGRLVGSTGKTHGRFSAPGPTTEVWPGSRGEPKTPLRHLPRGEVTISCKYGSSCPMPGPMTKYSASSWASAGSHFYKLQCHTQTSMDNDGFYGRLSA